MAGDADSGLMQSFGCTSMEQASDPMERVSEGWLTRRGLRRVPLATCSEQLEVSASSGLLGAPCACGHHEGIACILGTGTKLCLFDSESIVANTPALGFILGDEGGGAALGKRFLNAIFKGLLPAAMRDDYLTTTGLTLNDVIRRVYREPMPNRFLSPTSLYISEHLDNDALRSLVVDNFRQFFSHNVHPADDAICR